MTRIPGALHMHTTYSDGTGTVAQLARAAREAGLQWIIITDHDTLQGAPEAGNYDGTLVIVGHEITPDRNHLLALNVDTVISNRLSPQACLNELYARGGFGIIAHPDERVTSTYKACYRWDDWSVSGPQPRAGRVVGIELWNAMSDWGEHLTRANALPMVLFPQLGLSGPSLEALAWWDRLNIEGQRTFGVGGVDAHALRRRAPWGEITVLPYDWIFRTLTVYLLADGLLSGDAYTATHQVYAALTAGRHYFANRRLGDASAIQFEAHARGQVATMGDMVQLAGGVVTLRAEAPGSTQLRLIHNGRLRAEGRGQLRHTVAEPGVYRLEGYRQGRPWLFTNPIFLEH